MHFKLHAQYTFSNDITAHQEEIKTIITTLFSEAFQKTQSTGTIKELTVQDTTLDIQIDSQESRPHQILLQSKNIIAKQLGQQYHIGIREIKVKTYDITFQSEKKALHPTTIPYAEVQVDENNITLKLNDLDEEFLRKNYIDRMISRTKEKIENQYYEGKAEFWNEIWNSGPKEHATTTDPTDEMVKLGWLKQGPTKGKWFYRPQAAAILKTMEKIALEEVLKPLGFSEIIESNLVPFDIWLKTGHLEGMPGEFYYVSEPKTRDTKEWERFVDLAKITKEVPTQELSKNVAEPIGGLCYAQCPMIYWSLKGNTISEQSLPVLIYDNTAVSYRYESGGRHGIERVDEFHRIEPVYIGTREQLLELRENMLERYKHVFNNIFELEWRMAFVTPWYMQQAGKIGDKGTLETGTIDFEAYMPYRGSREKSEWLEFQNLSILGDKYIKAFNIKGQKSQLWSGCSGIGLQRWTTAFLAQKGLDPDNWPKEFKKYLPKLPKGIELL